MDERPRRVPHLTLTPRAANVVRSAPRGDQGAEIPAADDAGVQPVSVLPTPVRFEANRAGVAVAGQGANLPRPIDRHLAQGTPRRSVAVDHAVLGVDVDDAPR